MRGRVRASWLLHHSGKNKGDCCALTVLVSDPLHSLATGPPAHRTPPGKSDNQMCALREHESVTVALSSCTETV